MHPTVPQSVRRRSILLALVLEATAGLAIAPETRATEAAARGPLTIDALWRIQRLGDPAISPDGAWAVVPVTDYDVKEDKGKTDLWLIPTAGGAARRLTTHDARDAAPAWSPDGKWILFESKRGDDDESQIYVIPVEGGEGRGVTSVPTGAASAKWFPDSKRIAFVSWVWPDVDSWEKQGLRLKEREDAKLTAKTWNKPIVRWWDHWVEDREPHLYSVSIDATEPQPVTLGTGRCLSRQEPGRDSFDISPDGAEVAFTADVDSTGVDPDFDVFVVAAGGGPARNVSAETTADESVPLYSPDGRWLAFGRQTIRGFYADRVRLVLHERVTRQNRVATEAWDRSVAGLVWTPDGRALYGAIDDAGNQRVWRIDVPSGKAAPVTKDHSFSGLALARDGRTLVALRQSFLEPPSLVRVDLASGRATKLSTFNDELLASVDLGTYESVTYQGAKGEPVQMWVNYPPGFDRSKRWPVYLLLHGGPHNGITDSFHWRWNAQVFSGWGYVTAWHNFHGSSGFGQTFTDSINPEQSELPYEDTILAAKWLAAQPWIDAARLTAGGGSFGGYLASVLLGREHPFQALVAHAAVYNWYTQYGADYGAFQRRHGEFWENPAVFAKSSPHYGAKHFATPTLVVHGELDYRVPLNHGIELFQTLQNRGVRSRLVYYPNENHWVLKPNNSIHWYGEVRAWIEEFAVPGPR